MTLNKIASAIAKVEGKKHQASISDIREILKIIIADGEIIEALDSLNFDLIVKLAKKKGLKVKVTKGKK